MKQQAQSNPFAVTVSPGFAGWLAATSGSLAVSTYQAGKLFLIGTNPEGGISLFDRSFSNCMGLAISPDGHSLALATKFQIHRFDNVLRDGALTNDGYDALYAPHVAWVTGDLDTHDLGWGADGRPVFVNTLFACISTVSDGHNFRPSWQPSFISSLVPEDRCHLNGMAMDEGIPRFATAVARSDSADGWRDQRRDGGIVIDIATDQVIATGLSMPHSPRLHDGKLWLLDSGRGAFGFLDPGNGRFEPVAFCPGYARGLAFVDGHAVIGLSLPRQNHNFSGLDLDDALVKHGATPRCGLVVIDLVSGELAHWLRIDGVVRELYDVVSLAGIRRPSAIGFKSDEVTRTISIEQ